MAGGWDFKQTNGMSMVDAQFIESRRFELEEIARHYGIPSFMINDTTKTTSWGSGMQEIIETWLKVSLDALLVHWEDSVSYTLLSADEIEAGLHFKFNRRKLLEQTPEKQAAFLQSMRSIGVYSVNDVRRKLDENDLADPDIGEDYTLPFNNTGVAAAAKAATSPDGNPPPTP
jgi:HK97 family phage portal protein